MIPNHIPADDQYCASFLPGHKLHWSLYKAAASSPTVLVSEVIQDGTMIELVVPGEESMHWQHHDPQRLAAALEGSISPILACPDWRALRIDGYWFNCAPVDVDLSVCC